MFAEFPHDPRCLVDSDDMMLGSSMLVAPVVDAGQATRDVYLPSGTRWVSYWSGEAFDGAQTVTLPAPFERPVFLLRVPVPAARKAAPSRTTAKAKHGATASKAAGTSR
jgi:alpha-glucosidase